MAKVWEDDEGLYIRTGGYVFRPGFVTGYGHALRMDDGGLRAGGTVKARHRGGTPTAKIGLEDGSIVFWHAEGEMRDSKLYEPSGDEIYDAGGRRQYYEELRRDREA